MTPEREDAPETIICPWAINGKAPSPTCEPNKRLGFVPIHAGRRSSLSRGLLWLHFSAVERCGGAPRGVPRRDRALGGHDPQRPLRDLPAARRNRRRRRRREPCRAPHLAGAWLHGRRLLHLLRASGCTAHVQPPRTGPRARA